MSTHKIYTGNSAPWHLHIPQTAAFKRLNLSIAIAEGNAGLAVSWQQKRPVGIDKCGAGGERGGWRYVPRLSDRQIEALDLMDDLAGSEAFHLDHEWRPGDMNFVHNHQIPHARTDYEDYPELERKRHLLRLWLSTNHGWELPPVFAEKYGALERGKRRGGIHVPGMELTAPLEAE